MTKLRSLRDLISATALTAATALSAAAALTGAVAFAQGTARDELARGVALWNQRLSKSALTALEVAAQDRATAAEAHEALGRVYTFKGWQQDNVFPGWHDEPSYRDRAIVELKASLAADPSRASAQEALRAAEAFAAADRVDPAPPRPEIKALDAQVEAARTAPLSEFLASVEARTRAQADPAPYFAAAQILIDRGEFDQAIVTSDRGVRVSERFVDENSSAYQMEGKRQGILMRARGTAADLAGWALFMKKEYPGAATKLEEAERLYRGLDFLNQFHLGELAHARNEPERARDYYLNALSLSVGPQPLRQRATEALAALRAGAQGPTGFQAWLDQELARRRDERRDLALKSLVDKPLPALSLTTLDGGRYDAAGLRGKVLLLNFFASW